MLKFVNSKAALVLRQRQLLLALRHLSSASEFTWRPPSPASIDTGIKVYNCVARQNVPLLFPNKHLVTWYTCGPTVYDSAHVGHASCYVRLDIIQRLLRDHFGVRLVTAMNITDIDDKIINRSWSTEEPWQQLAKRYENEFWRDCDNLGIRRPDVVLRVSERLPEIIDFIAALLKQGSAYIGRDNSVYFDNKLTSGKLQNIPMAEEQETTGEATRRTANDFVLWKAAKPGEPSWPVPWSAEGAGRPGWHTECSAMASHLFGHSIDIHGGGMDLRFPHHENEENQCCTFHDTPQWVNYWIHVGQLHCDDTVKMSKSLKNTVSIESMLGRFTSNQFRMACLLSNYHSQMSYNEASMSTACNVLRRFNTFIDESAAALGDAASGIRIDRDGMLAKIDETTGLIDQSLKNNFTTSKALEHLLDLITFANKSLSRGSIGAADARTGFDALIAARNLVVGQLNVFGIEARSQTAASDNKGVSDQFIDDIVEMRQGIRNEALASKDDKAFKMCSDIRNVLAKHHIEVKDLPKGADGTSKSRWLRQEPKVSKPSVKTKEKKEKKK